MAANVTVIHSARLVTAHEDLADAWVILAAGRVAARGAGSDWREALAGLGRGLGNELGLAVESDVELVDAGGLLLVPGFVDMHCHGAAGVAFDDPDFENVSRALALHRGHGTTRFMLSLVTAPVAVLTNQVARIAALTGQGLGVLGSHLEGPFLAEEFKGAHDPTMLCHADEGSIDALVAAGAGGLQQVTLAPELPGGMAAIERFAAAGVTVAVGHTAADYEAARAAFDAGASVLTHAFNGMRGIHHRAPGPVVAAMTAPHVTLELINDGVHVHPEVVRLACAGAPGRVALITDAMAATGCSDGRYKLGSLDVDVLDGVARLAQGGSIAGSTLTLDVALKRAVQLCGVPVQQAVAALTVVPAKALGVADHYGDLTVGYPGDAVLLDADFAVVSVWADGARAA